MKKKVNAVTPHHPRIDISDIEKHVLGQVVAQIERAEIRRELRREELKNDKCRGARATNYRFSY